MVFGSTSHSAVIYKKSPLCESLTVAPSSSNVIVSSSSSCVLLLLLLLINTAAATVLPPIGHCRKTLTKTNRSFITSAAEEAEYFGRISIAKLKMVIEMVHRHISKHQPLQKQQAEPCTTGVAAALQGSWSGKVRIMWLIQL